MIIANLGEIYSALFEIWDKNSPRLPDAMRDPDVLDRLIWGDGAETQFYIVEECPTIIIAHGIDQGLNANVILLNHDFAEVGQILRELRGIIDQWDLRRLTANVPAPVKDLAKTLEMVGFRREGHLRRSTFYDGRLCGTNLYALYRDPPREQRRSTTSSAAATPRGRVPAPPPYSSEQSPDPPTSDHKEPVAPPHEVEIVGL